MMMKAKLLVDGLHRYTQMLVFIMHTMIAVTLSNHIFHLLISLHSFIHSINQSIFGESLHNFFFFKVKAGLLYGFSLLFYFHHLPISAWVAGREGGEGPHLLLSSHH